MIVKVKYRIFEDGCVEAKTAPIGFSLGSARVDKAGNEVNVSAAVLAGMAGVSVVTCNPSAKVVEEGVAKFDIAPFVRRVAVLRHAPAWEVEAAARTLAVGVKLEAKR